jgi:hypothetical protein
MTSRAMTTAVYASNSAASSADLGYWARTLSPQERVAFAWEISEQL